MKSMWVPSEAIFFMTYFHRAGSATGLLCWLSVFQTPSTVLKQASAAAQVPVILHTSRTRHASLCGTRPSSVSSTTVKAATSEFSAGSKKLINEQQWWLRSNQ